MVPSSLPMSGPSLETCIGITGGILGAIAGADALNRGYRRHQKMKAANKEGSIRVAGAYQSRYSTGCLHVCVARFE